jgi:hypothetical protein
MFRLVFTDVPVAPVRPGGWHNCCARIFQRVVFSGDVKLQNLLILNCFIAIGTVGIAKARAFQQIV